MTGILSCFHVVLLGLIALIALRIAQALESLVKGPVKEEAPQPYDYHAEEQKDRPRKLGGLFRSNKKLRQPGEGDDEGGMRNVESTISDP